MRCGVTSWLGGCFVLGLAMMLCAPTHASGFVGPTPPVIILPSFGFTPSELDVDYSAALARTQSQEADLRARIKSLLDHTAVLPPNPVETPAVEAFKAEQQLSVEEAIERDLRTRMQERQAARAGVIFPQARITLL